MESGNAIYFAVNRGGALILSIPIIVAWWPSHYFFKWLSRNGDTDTGFALVSLGIWAGFLSGYLGMKKWN